MRIQVPPPPRPGTVDHYLFVQHRDRHLERAIDKLEILDIYGGSDADYREAEARCNRAYQRAALRAAIAIRREAGEARTLSRLHRLPTRHHHARRCGGRARSSRRRARCPVRGDGSDPDGPSARGLSDPAWPQPFLAASAPYPPTREVARA